MSAEAVIRMPGEGKELTLAGKPLVFLVTGEDSKHTCMFEWTVPAGFSTGLHVHRVQEETFYVLEGECEWQIGDHRVSAKPGAYVFIPPGVKAMNSLAGARSLPKSRAVRDIFRTGEPRAASATMGACTGPFLRARRVTWGYCRAGCQASVI